MVSSVLDPDLAAALDSVAAGLDSVFEAGVEPFDTKDAIVLIRETERLVRRFQAAQNDLFTAIDRRGLHRADGHASAKVMVRHVGNLSDVEALRRAKTAKALADLPVVAESFRAGRIGRCQTDTIARAHANKRVREQLCDRDAELAGEAESMGHRFFDGRLNDWVRETDEDGTCDRAQRGHQNRDAQMDDVFGEAWRLIAHGGSLQGAEMHSILEKFIEAEWLSDWEKARAEHGDDTTVEHLARTDAQRRFDALFEIFRRAASIRQGEPGSMIVTNLLIDQATFERILRRMTDTPTETPDHPIGDVPGEVGFRCSTIDGHPVDPTEAVAHALTGHVRRVVIGADSTVIDLSRRRRLFTGAAALAVKLANTECYWPGCHVPVSDCQIDHLVPWADHGGGSTCPSNGGPACGKHNRHKEQGFTAWRDESGQWHVLRPDGTEIE